MDDSINPYQLLGVSEDSTLEQVKEAYKQLALKHHPDKGGNPETFKIYKLAFKMIVDSIKKGVKIQKQTASSFVDMRESAKNYQPVNYQTPTEFFNKPVSNPNVGFSADAFNQKFMQSAKDDANCLLANPETDYRENRTKEQLLSEQKAIENDMSSIQPIFGQGEFSNSTFQRLFETINGTPEKNIKDLQRYEEPEALVSGLQAYTEIDENQRTSQTSKFSSLGFGELNAGFGQQNPTKIDRELVTKMATQADITKVSTLEPEKMKQRLNEYNNLQLNFHPAPANPNQLPEQLQPIRAQSDFVSQQKCNESFNSKLQERNQLFQDFRGGAGAGGGCVNQRQMPPPASPCAPAFMGPQQGGRRLQQQFPQGGRGGGGIPIMEYPRSSNGGGFGGDMTQGPQGPQGPQGGPDYFVKMPMVSQMPQQMPPQQMVPNFFVQPQMLPQLPPLPQLPQQNLQQQLQDLQKVVNEQNRKLKRLERRKK